MAIPEPLAGHLTGWQHIGDERIGRSGTNVDVFEHAGTRRYLKWTQGEGDLGQEADRMRWWRGRVPVPDVVAFHEDGTGQYLLLDELRGVIACDPRFGDRVDEVIRRVAGALRLVHAMPVTDCPFDRSPHMLLEEADHRVASGLVDPSDFSPEFQGRTPDQLLSRLRHRIPERYVPTIVHGDFSLPNVLLTDEEVGLVDLGSSGVGDRHVDLVAAEWSVAYNWGDVWVPRFFEAYGQFPDPERMNWYRILRELI